MYRHAVDRARSGKIPDSLADKPAFTAEHFRSAWMRRGPDVARLVSSQSQREGVSPFLKRVGLIEEALAMHLAILGSGMMTGVGLNAPATCAAMRAGLSGFTETTFNFLNKEPVIGAPVPLQKPWRGIAKLARLAAPAIRECLSFFGNVKPEAVPLLLCVAEPNRPGRLDGLDDDLISELEKILKIQLHPKSSLIARGRIGGAVALDTARRLIHHENFSHCLIVGVDSFLVGPTIAAYEAKNRLLTAANSNGFIPGEAAAAVLVAPAGVTGGREFCCVALGFGQEKATIDSEEPLRGEGLVQAYRALQADGGVTLDDADYRFTDCNGEQYGFKEDCLAFSRVVRKLKARFDHLHPADSIGEIGAAVGPCVLGLALAAAKKGYAPGNAMGSQPGNGVLCHFSNDEGDRAALLLRHLDRNEIP
jgi:3-oxoacyl-[acyl-carrier-protein] synthase-1